MLANAGIQGYFLVLVITCWGDWRILHAAVAISFVYGRRWFSDPLEMYQQRRRSVELRVTWGFPAYAEASARQAPQAPQANE
jgi:hypothetical protein